MDYHKIMHEQIISEVDKRQKAIGSLRHKKVEESVAFYNADQLRGALGFCN